MLYLSVIALLISDICLASNNFIQQGLEDIYAETPTCSPIKIPACQGLPYNNTIFPNNVGHATQDEAGRDISQFDSLVRVGCSSSLKLFLCTLYFPVCTEVKKPLPPCRSLCQQNRLKCEPIMREFHFEVPRNYGFKIRLGDEQIVDDCGIPCDRYLFDETSRRFSRLWIGLWSCLCAASTLFTVLTFLIDMPRFQYPERPIIYLSACYLMIALTYVAGFILHDKVACSGPFPPPNGAVVNPTDPTKRLITQGTKFEGCIILSMLLYFFTMASAIWWVVLTITWYLAAKCHWAHEAISRNAQYLHFAAWALPAAKTIGVLAFGGVDGDPLSGVCFTGLTDTRILKGFLITPLCVYLLIGTGFLIAGFLSLFKIRSIIKTEGSKTDDLEKLIMRIGIFSLLYIIPALFVIGCYIYEAQMIDKWTLSWFANEVCSDGDGQHGDFICPEHMRRLLYDFSSSMPTSVGESGGGGSSSDSTSSSQTLDLLRSLSSSSKKLNVKPEFELFMIKYLMTLIVGITSGIWIWSGKTLLSWQHFFQRRCCCRTNSQLPVDQRHQHHPLHSTPLRPVGMMTTAARDQHLQGGQNPATLPLLATSPSGVVYPPSGEPSSPPSYDWISAGSQPPPQQSSNNNATPPSVL